jgi:hypothetical protein
VIGATSPESEMVAFSAVAPRTSTPAGGFSWLRFEIPEMMRGAGTRYTQCKAPEIRAKLRTLPITSHQSLLTSHGRRHCLRTELPVVKVFQHFQRVGDIPLDRIFVTSFCTSRADLGFLGEGRPSIDGVC